jgi:hypothetical protein
MMVLLRIRSRRYTIVIRSHVTRQNTVVNREIRSVHGRLRAYMESVFVDLGLNHSVFLHDLRKLNPFSIVFLRTCASYTKPVYGLRISPFSAVNDCLRACLLAPG